MKGADILDYIDQKVKDGVEGLTIYGVPKSGKSNMVRRINKDCMVRHKENLIMPGTVNCEWRNLLYHPDKPVKDFKILVPHDYKISGYLIPPEISAKTVKTDFSKIKIADYLEDKEQFLLVIYDNHYRDLEFPKRIAIWNEIAKQLNDRTFQVEIPIGLTFDEAGVYFPQLSLADHFIEVYRFSMLTVDFRKNNVRFIGISQLDTEIVNTIREKQYWTILRKGIYSKRVPLKVRKGTPFYALDQYAILEGGVYTRDNRVKKMPETDSIMKMIPQEQLEIMGDKESKINRKHQKEMFVNGVRIGLSVDNLCKTLMIPQSTGYRWKNEIQIAV